MSNNMQRMSGTQDASVSETRMAEGGPYTCPMHPEVRSDQPGRCPKCGMALVPAPPKSYAQQASKGEGADLVGQLVRMCLNWRVVAGLAAVGLGVWIVAPQLVAAVLPLLVLAACPLSMVFMMRAMQGHRTSPHVEGVKQPADASIAAADRVSELKSQLAQIDARSAAIQKEIAQLEAPAASEQSAAGANGSSRQTQPQGSGTRQA